jgi:isoquinoline 1-oxidoreductase
MVTPLFDDFEPEPERYELLGGPPVPLTVDRRTFLKTVGGGLIVLSLLREADAQQRQGGGGRGGAPAPREIDAWVHVDEDGRVTACSGKAEVGQNARTSLTMAVADELGLPMGSVRMVLGDTDLVPFDPGTFGSRTTPTMVPQLRRAAAAARGVLLGLAAERWEVKADTLAVGEGRILHPPTGRTLGFGELTKGRRLVETIDEGAQPTPPSRWEVAGKSQPKVDARAIVTGKHRYSSDMTRPGMLRGKVLRAPSSGAKIEKLDAAAAEAMTGVTVVHEGPFLGVVAPDEPTATKALAALRAEWSRDVRERPSDQTVFRDFGQVLDEARKGRSTEVAEALAGADVKIEATYTAAYIAHAPLETRAALAEWAGGRLTVWTGTQRPFGVRSDLASALGLSEDKVRVIVPDTGSGYGGKHTGEAALEAARLARASGRPVKVVWTREEEFREAYFRPAALIGVNAGARRDGTLVGWEFHNVNSGNSGVETPYAVAGKRTAFHQARSPLRQGSYRALASTANHFARESMMDELANKLGLDPLDFRLKNLKDERLRAVLKAAADHFQWSAGPREKGNGIGLACGTEKGGFIATCAEIKANADATEVEITRVVAAFECGAIVNPDHLKNQVEGAVVMGVGGALFEAIRFEDGQVKNGRFSRYRVPRMGDVPSLDVVLIDRRDLPAAGGGECPIVAIAPAIANAIAAATGLRKRSMPLLARETS